MLRVLGALALIVFATEGHAARRARRAGPPPKFGTDQAAAFQAAARYRRPLLISFYGIWCPPCNQMEETVFQSPAFLEKARRFQLLKVDADAKASWKLKDRYKVGGYPTYVFTDPKGNETFRVVGARSADEFVRAMEIALASSKKPYDQACASDMPQDLWRCTLISMEQKNVAAAKAAFEKLEPKLAKGSSRIEIAKTFFVESADSDETKRQGYEELLTRFPHSPLALVWAHGYLSLESGKPKKDLVERSLAGYEKMVADYRAEEMGMSEAGLAQAKASVLERLGQSDAAKKSWAEAAAILDRRMKELPPGVPARGFALERMYCLENAGDQEAAFALAQEYVKKYPKEFTFQYKIASLLERRKRYPEALPVARTAFEVSYGDNRVRAAILLIKLLATVPDRPTAQKVYDQVKKEIQPDAKLEVRTHRYLKALDEAWASFPAPPEAPEASKS